MTRSVGASEFKAKCLKIINQMNQDHEPVTITRRGRPVAVLSPAGSSTTGSSILGAMEGTVLGYEEPFLPVSEPSEWAALR